MNGFLRLLLEFIVIVWAITSTYLLINIRNNPSPETKINSHINNDSVKIVIDSVVLGCNIKAGYQFDEQGTSKRSHKEFIDCINEKIFFYAEPLLIPKFKQKFRDSMDKLIKQLHKTIGIFYCYQWVICGNSVHEGEKWVVEKTSEALLGMVIEEYSLWSYEMLKDSKEEWYATHPERQPDTTKPAPPARNDPDETK